MTDTIAITQEEAVAIMAAFATAHDEGQLSGAAARFAVRLLDWFGEDIVASSDRSWFPKALRGECD